MIHIDYGFILGISPGHNMGFEASPFKLSREMIELLGGTSSQVFELFAQLTVQCFLASRQIMKPILAAVVAFADSNLPCFQFRSSVLKNLKNRFVADLTEVEAARFAKSLIQKACSDWTGSAYDGVQKLQNNIYSEEWR